MKCQTLAVFSPSHITGHSYRFFNDVISWLLEALQQFYLNRHHFFVSLSDRHCIFIYDKPRVYEAYKANKNRIFIYAFQCINTVTCVFRNKLFICKYKIKIKSWIINGNYLHHDSSSSLSVVFLHVPFWCPCACSGPPVWPTPSFLRQKSASETKQRRHFIT